MVNFWLVRILYISLNASLNNFLFKEIFGRMLFNPLKLNKKKIAKRVWRLGINENIESVIITERKVHI